MEDLVFSIVIFFVTYLFYLLFVIMNKKRIEKLKNGTYVTYLVNVYKLDLNRINIKVLGHIIALTNSFILASVLFIMSFIKPFILKLLISIIVLIPVQLLMYHIIGKMYEKSGQTKRKEVKK